LEVKEEKNTKIFTIQVEINGEIIAIMENKSKRRAEQLAAQVALDKVEEIN
jgi:dsRNA-specific ribonuclease